MASILEVYQVQGVEFKWCLDCAQLNAHLAAQSCLILQPHELQPTRSSVHRTLQALLTREWLKHRFKAFDPRGDLSLTEPSSR